jgi:hypothetical protein
MMATSPVGALFMAGILARHRPDLADEGDVGPFFAHPPGLGLRYALFDILRHGRSGARSGGGVLGFPVVVYVLSSARAVDQLSRSAIALVLRLRTDW